jgi:uncharacterized membrane protein YphA (DoxX/SURF4 family)
MTDAAAPREVRSSAASAALLVLRLGLAVVFLGAAYFKLMAENGAQNFSEAVQAFKVISDYDGLVMLTTYAVPWLEAIAAVCLLVGFWTRPAALVLALLLGLFIALIVSLMLRNAELAHALAEQVAPLAPKDPERLRVEARIDDLLNVKCGCFGKYRLLCEGTVTWCKVGENALLTLLAVTLAHFGGGRYAADARCCKPAA